MGEDDTTVPNCELETPFYDGVACIECPEPFIIFNLETNECMLCDPESQYNETSHACEPREVIYISENEDKLMATRDKSIDDYHEDVTDKINSNPEAIIQNCEN